jgi:hypothetical protein
VDKELEAVLAKTWDIYRKERCVISEPHVLVKIHEDATHESFVEIFTWTGCFAMEYPSDAVWTLWRQAEPLCEARNGRRAIEYRSVTKMIAPKIPEPTE